MSCPRRRAEGAPRRGVEARRWNHGVEAQRPPWRLEVKQLLEDAHGVIRTFDRVAGGGRVIEDFPVIATLEGLVAEEVDGFVLDAARPLGLVSDVTKTVGLVPAVGEDVEGDLAADGVAGASRGSMAGQWRGEDQRGGDRQPT